MARLRLAWMVRAGVVAVLVLLNLTVGTAARSADCERCAYCFQGMELVVCCVPAGAGGLCGNTDCHDDDNECHYHGDTCCPG
jgi:hypothetical protein